MNMFRFNLRLLLTIVFCLSANAKFPTEPKPCNYGDTDCIGKVIEFFLHEKYQGDGSINLVGIDPLPVKEISIKQGAESPVNIDLQFMNNKLYGLKDSKVLKVKGFGKDMTQKHDLLLMVPQIDLAGHYKIDGRVLVLPITGTGTNNITLYNVGVKLQFTGAPLEKDGATYMNVEKFRFDLDPKSMHFQIDNLFNGDKALGDNMNLFLNENWVDIFHELKAPISAAFGQIFASVIGRVFSKYPYDKFFSE